MTLDFRFHPEAAAEFYADIDWYDDQEVGIGGRFAEAIRAAVDAAIGDPGAWAVCPGREPLVRSKGVKGFPYRVVYFVQDDVLTIVAVAHSKRRPGYWRARVSE